MTFVSRFVVTIFLFTYSCAAFGKDIHATRINFPITLDGKLDEAIWSTIQPVSDFTQKEPNQGAAPSEKTSVWVLYDDDAVYIGARMYDSHPDSIVQILGRKDYFTTGDWFGVYIDGYHDKRSGNFFYIGPAGTVGDGVLYNDDWNDSDWDGVWQGKSNIDDQGWTMEMRIPFSQIRFRNSNHQVWGINFERDIGRNNESDYVVYSPRNQSGFVSRFPDLVGIEGVVPSGQTEVFPFFTTKAEYTHPSSGDPFNDGSRYTPDFGADVRYRLNSNLILNGTLNPDFGQVEVDPAVVNLSDVESYFQEKRPFFVEGANTFTNFGQGGGRNYWNANFSNPTLFYSRRIGHSPYGNDSLDNADHVDMPIATKIIGAGKVTGKIGDVWNLGTIHAVTAREFAQYQQGGIRSEAEVEPLTYYGVARLQRDFDNGSQGLGMLATLTSRRFTDTPTGKDLRNNLNSNGLFTGIDGWTFLDTAKAWVITGWAGMSYVDGSRERLLELQTNSQHYFQRPDVGQVFIDSNATSMTGFAGRFYLIKQKGNFFFNSAIGFLDPKFEINDLGFLGRTDVINAHIGGGYNWPDPDGIFRRKELGGMIFQSVDYSGHSIGRGFFHFGNLQLNNFYWINWGFGAGTQSYNQRRTRGGPLTLSAPYTEYQFGINSDDSKSFTVNPFYYGNSSLQSSDNNYELYIQYRPVPQLTVSIDPSYELSFNAYQYINTVDDPTATATYGKRYIFGELHQKTFGAGIRLNWTFTPTLSLQVYAQPFISSGLYAKYNELAQPGTNNYLYYGTGNSTIQKSGDEYTVDADGSGPAVPVTFSEPNFNYKSLRGNAVLRWEYLPGSVLYFVWTQSRTDQEEIGDFHFNHSLSRLIDSRADNIFLIKMNYYLDM